MDFDSGKDDQTLAVRFTDFDNKKVLLVQFIIFKEERCAWRFGGAECLGNRPHTEEYATATSCDATLETCRRLGNSSRYVGTHYGVRVKKDLQEGQKNARD